MLCQCACGVVSEPEVKFVRNLQHRHCVFRYDEEAPAEPEAAFTEKTIPVVRDSLESTGITAVRYYEDLPGVPYMSVTDFYINTWTRIPDFLTGIFSRI